MSREDTKNQEKTNIKPDEATDISLGLSNTEANHQLAQLGSPFAHIPTPADLIDLWDDEAIDDYDRDSPRQIDGGGK